MHMRKIDLDLYVASRRLFVNKCALYTSSLSIQYIPPRDDSNTSSVRAHMSAPRSDIFRVICVSSALHMPP